MPAFSHPDGTTNHMPASKTSRASVTRTRAGRTRDTEDGSAATPAVDGRPLQSAALLDALRSVARELRLVGRDAEQRVGIHRAQLHALHQLAKRPCDSLAELAERTHTDPSSVSVVVQRLVERGLVERTPAADDRRRTELRATPAGRALLRRAPESAVRRLEGALTSVGPRDLGTVTKSLVALARTLRAQNPGDKADG
jgi:DNA-binding MarR family transcriptional regulator